MNKKGLKCHKKHGWDGTQRKEVRQCMGKGTEEEWNGMERTQEVCEQMEGVVGMGPRKDVMRWRGKWS
jgi:hypothetical protein